MSSRQAGSAGRSTPAAAAKSPRKQAAVRRPATAEVKGAPQGPFLVTAFEPFDGRKTNRSLLTLHRLRLQPGQESAILPVDYLALPDFMADLLERKPRALLLMGEADRDKVSVEQVAVNILDSETPDNAGRVVRGRPVVPDGELALRASWDACAVADAMVAAGVPAAPSFHAGTFACNASLYLALHGLKGTNTRVGFLHLPRKALKPAMLIRAAQAAMKALDGS
jgi:pyroglutamyl-peptidase